MLREQQEVIYASRKEREGRLMARRYIPNMKDSDARMRPHVGNLPGGNIVDGGYAVKGVLTWQRMAGNKSNAATRPTGPLVDPNTRDKPYHPGAER